MALAEEMSWADRLTADGIVWRGRAMTVDGAPVTGYYPAALLAWRLSDLGGRGALRLHASYGESGSGSMDLATAAFTVQPFEVTFSRPVADERTIERVVGLDASVGRLTMRLARYQSSSSQLFVVVPVACATGFCPRGILEGASVSNSGVELTLNSTLLDREHVHWDATLIGSTLRNRLTHLPSAPFYIGSQYYAQGSPLGALWGRPYTYTDVNGDHMLAPSEVEITASQRYLGTSVPTLEAGLLSSLALGNRVSGFVHLDYRGGQKRPNINEQVRCSGALNCRGLMDASASLGDQAAAILAGGLLENSYVEDARFLRLHAVGVSWRLTGAWARWLSASSAISVTGYDLFTWTPYRGLDPEIASWTVGSAPTYDLARTPILPRLELRLDLGDRGLHE